MKILLVNWQDLENPDAGGAELHLFALFGRLVAWGHEVRLVCSGWPGAPEEAVVDGIRVTRRAGRHTFALAGRRAVRRVLADWPCDVLVEDINKLPLFLATVTSRPLVVIVPHLFGTAAFAEASWPVAATVVAAERRIPAAYRRAWFHVISESTRDDLIARGIPAARIEVIHPGIDVTPGLPDVALDRADPPFFLYVGRLRRYKGVEVAVRALALARGTRPDLMLHVAGTGDDRARLEAVARDLGQTSAVHFHGFVDESAKQALLRAAWANLLPSPKEGWGLTVMEAAACGTPSIASDSPGLRDSVRHGQTGYLVPHGDAESLARRMLELAADRTLVDRLGRAARQRAEEWSWDAAARATEAHLARVLAAERL